MTFKKALIIKPETKKIIYSETDYNTVGAYNPLRNSITDNPEYRYSRTETEITTQTDIYNTESEM